MKTEERRIKLSHIFEKWLWQHCSHSSLFFLFFRQCTLSNCYSGHLLLKQIESFQLLLKHLRKKDRRWLLLIIKKEGKTKNKKLRGRSHIKPGDITSASNQAGTTLFTPWGNFTPVYFTSRLPILHDSATDVTELPSRWALSIIPDTETWTVLLGNLAHLLPFIVCCCHTQQIKAKSFCAPFVLFFPLFQ